MPKASGYSRGKMASSRSTADTAIITGAAIIDGKLYVGGGSRTAGTVESQMWVTELSTDFTPM